MAIAPSRIAPLKAHLRAWRRALHQCPEVGLELPLTTAYLQAQLRAMGLEPRTLGRGFVVDLGPAPRVAWRVDRLKALGNGQVPRVAATAFAHLAAQFN